MIYLLYDYNAIKQPRKGGYIYTEGVGLTYVQMCNLHTVAFEGMHAPQEKF